MSKLILYPEIGSEGRWELQKIHQDGAESLEMLLDTGDIEFKITVGPNSLRQIKDFLK